ncbi:MAG TPA: bifunctional serine/threonine-protein kinase/formylglycine-generating enzyme family protein [Vicinamibacteria bacterium]|nr:bifunctional serine/threonine-protein kinase/formylglycine-generating enzyme family protein [Vicinamibacteria bacterium]
MTPERWQRLETLFQAAIGRPPEERDAYLAEACRDDPGLRDELERLVAAHDESRGLMEELALPAFSVLSSGARLGRYEIVALVGYGGMGQVYRALDTRLGRDVAIKVLPQPVTASAVAMARFEREARAVANLSHPNILAIHDFERVDGVAFAVTELLDGETLRARMQRGRIPLHEALLWAVQIARGLAAAHGAGIVHRDLKPENIFLTRAGVAKILDFGLAKQVSRPATRRTPTPTSTLLTTPGLLLGTAGYMSPEQVRGEPADQRSDVFSYGVVLYEMLSGRRAFDGETVVETMNAILRSPPRPLSPAAGIPARVADLVSACLTPRLDQRTLSAAQIVSALEALKVVPETAARTRRWALGLRAAFILAVAAAIGAGAQAYRQAAQRRRDLEGRAPVVFRTNARDGAEYARLPSGTFTMGCAPPDSDCETFERPQIRVTIPRPLWMMRHEVSVAQYRAFAAATGRAMPPAPAFDPDWKLEKHPVVNVDWFEAGAYCAWAGGRLPSEAEWEYAAKATHDAWKYVSFAGPVPLYEGRLYDNASDDSWTRKYGAPPISDPDPVPCTACRMPGYDDGWVESAPVGTFLPNDFGLYDMGGNVSEWVQDQVRQKPGTTQAADLSDYPRNGRPVEFAGGFLRTWRGPSWRSGYKANYVWMRSAGSSPYGRDFGLGIRCVRDKAP